MYDPLKAKSRIVVFVFTVFMIGAMAATGLGWTSPAHSMPDVTESPQVTKSAVRPAMDLSEAFTNLADAVTPAVVRIESRSTVARPSRDQVPEQFRRFFDEAPQEDEPPRSAIAGGSGFIVSRDGYILTNNHVVEGATELRVYFPDRRYFPARVIGADPFTDVAVIKVDVDGDLPMMAFGDSDEIKVGEWVLAIGNPGFGASTQLDFTVTAGIISARGRNVRLLQNDLFNDPRFSDTEFGNLSGYAIEDFIQTDAAINFGNSGGPLVDINGRAIGINTAINASGQGIGFAIPISLAKGVMTQIIERGHVVRGWLGIEAQDLTPQLADSFGLDSTDGVLISGVLREGPADQAGLLPGDVITSINGRDVHDTGTAMKVISEQQPDTVIVLGGMREGKPVYLKVRVQQRPRQSGLGN